MATFTVWTFDTPEGADQAESTVLALQRQQLVHVDDAALVSWPETHRKPRIRQAQQLTGRGSLHGAFWGLLFGLLFLLPLLGATVGAAARSLAGQLSEVGVDDEFARGVTAAVVPGTSALFLLCRDEPADDDLRDVLPAGSVQAARSTLDEAGEARLRELFSG